MPMERPERPIVSGRGSQLDPPNRFESTRIEPDLEQVEGDVEYLEGLGRRATEYLPDRSRSVVSSNRSPDIPFTYSLNPYRGCAHGCSYCYARPTHEYLGWNAGLDFETKILVKHDAPALFRAFLMRERWAPEPIILSGVTDPYQPAERRFGLTRALLGVARDFGQPISLITKNALIVRDLDLLGPMARAGLVHANVSVTTLDQALVRELEPRTSAPEARLRAIRALADAGVPVRVLVAPVIPGLNDAEIPAILAAAKEAGARAAAYQMVRLPLAVAPVFLEWLGRCRPDRAEKVEGRIRAMRGGALNRAAFGDRMRGSGELADRIGSLFRVFARRYGLDGGLPPHDRTRFRRPAGEGEQLRLF